MLEILLFVCALMLIVWAPLEARKVRAGWKSPRYKGSAEDYRRSYAKQLRIFMWVAAAVALLDVVMAFIEAPNASYSIVKLALAASWAVAAGVMFYCQRLIGAANPAA